MAAELTVSLRRRCGKEEGIDELHVDQAAAFASCLSLLYPYVA
jgi:hypothetical protein